MTKPKKKLAKSTVTKIVYAGNDKHQKPWQRGRKGSLCTKADIAQAQQLLDASSLHGVKRFSTDGERAFAGAEHSPGEWHGWPVGWKEVPESIRQDWLEAHVVQRRSVRRHWHAHQGQN